MLVLDRVLCDLCGDDMGQLLAAPVQAPGILADQSKAPYFCVCPDCLDFSELDQYEAA